jgi:hypothetical protein
MFLSKPFTDYTAEDFLETAPFITGEVLHIDGGQVAGA